jgi:hypothetical protein
MDELAIFLMDLGSLCLILTIITSLVFCLNLLWYITLSIVVLLLWYIDFCLHIYCTNKTFEGKKTHEEKNKET